MIGWAYFRIFLHGSGAEVIGRGYCGVRVFDMLVFSWLDLQLSLETAEFL